MINLQNDAMRRRVDYLLVVSFLLAGCFPEADLYRRADMGGISGRCLSVNRSFILVSMDPLQRLKIFEYGNKNFSRGDDAKMIKGVLASGEIVKTGWASVFQAGDGSPCIDLDAEILTGALQGTRSSVPFCGSIVNWMHWRSIGSERFVEFDRAAVAPVSCPLVKY